MVKSYQNMVKIFHEDSFRDEFVEAWFRFSVDQELTCGREVKILFCSLNL